VSNIVPTNIKIPAHLAARIGQPSALAQSLAGGIAGGESYPRISIKGSRFRIIEGSTETVLDSTALDVIIVGANPRLSKTWYAKQWTPDAEPSAPDCFSLDGVRPHVDSSDPQNDMCAGCPQNAWGSKITPLGQQVKACADQKRLAVVAADDPSGPVYLLQVTPAALKGLNSYQKELATRGIAPEIVRSRVSFDTDASFPKLQFGFGGFLNETEMLAVDELFDSDKVKEITGEVAVSAPAALPAPKPAPVKAVPVKAVPAPEPEPTPEPKRGFGAKAAAPTPAPKAAPKPAAKPAAAPVVGGADLADEIASLLGGKCRRRLSPSILQRSRCCAGTCCLMHLIWPISWGCRA